MDASGSMREGDEEGTDQFSPQIWWKYHMGELNINDTTILNCTLEVMLGDGTFIQVAGTSELY
jgi:hypothetical protein